MSRRTSKKATNKSFVMRNRVFGVIALITIALLMIPLVAGQLTTAVQWTTSDFVLAAALLFSAGSALVLLMRRTEKKHWLPITIAFSLVVLYIWAELAIGIFTSIGS